ncbi:MAG: 4Fe-4S binding protein [Planctomycetes bacterium]|nr:4Fe-4S binding protein [Planctomycetota bacterium]
MTTPRRKLSRARVAFQVALHLVLIGHVLAYYYLGWKGVGALDFQAFFHYFLGKGLLTVGAILAIAVFGTALVFGRLFCSWGCHFGAWQDLAAWLMKRAGWRPPLLRTRFLHWAPYAVLLVVFGVPLAERWSSKGWEYEKTDIAAVAPWDTLPGLVGSIATYLGCGAALLLFFGTRGFCRFVCPYGAVFRATDLASPYRVRRVAPCGSVCGPSGAHPCTTACPTAIDVHFETNLRGHVVTHDCVRCNLCIEACPNGSLAHTTAGDAAERLRSSAVLAPEPGTAFRPIALPVRGFPAAPAPAGPRYDLPAWGEALVLAVAALAYVAADLVDGGHFLAAAIGLGEGFLALAALRAVLGDERASVLGRPLRRGRAWTLAGITVAGVFLLGAVPLLEAGGSKLLRRQGLRLDPWAESGAARDAAQRAEGPARERLLLAAGKYRQALALIPWDDSTRRLLIGAYVRLGDRRALDEAQELARRSGPGDPEAVAVLRWVLTSLGAPPGAGAEKGGR